MKNLCLGVLFVLSTQTAISQSLESINLHLTNFQGIEARGSLPEDFTETWVDKYHRNISGAEADAELTKDEQEELGSYWLSQQMQIDYLIHSGKFSFGDPLTNFLNTIKDTLLSKRPDLAKDIRLYLFKSPSVNAFCVADGMIGIHTGLIAHVKSEAELAFVIAHEISHYVSEHSFERYKDAHSFKKGWFTSSMHPVLKYDMLTSRSRVHEVEADSLGYLLFAESPYHSNAIDSALTTLHQSYLCFGRTRVESDFLASSHCTIPDVYFRTSLNPISREEDYFDKTHTHPNIASRREKLKAMKNSQSEGKSFHLQGEDKFFAIRDLARFEMIREKIIYGNYGEALYDIYVMEKVYPENRFLEISKGKALYGVASFAAIDKISMVSDYNYTIEGPSHQVMHLMKELSNEQVVSLALHHLLKLKNKYPEETMIEKYIDNLCMYLLIHTKSKPEDFTTSLDSLPPFEGAAESYDSERHYLRARQLHYREFHKYLLKDFRESGSMTQIMQKFIPLQDSLEAYRMLPYKEKEKFHEARAEKLEEEGSGLNVDEIILLDPTLYLYGDDITFDDLLESTNKQAEYVSLLEKVSGEMGIQPDFLYLDAMKAENEKEYNQFASLEEWVYEARMYDRFNLRPVNVDIAGKLGLKQRYVCRVIGLLLQGDNDYYYFSLYDLRNGERVYERSEKLRRNMKLKDLEEETRRDLFSIKN